MNIARTTKMIILAGATALAGGAAFSQSFATGDVNFRTGPGVSFNRLATIPRGAPVTINGCVPAGWCQVTFGYRDGWVSARYLGQAPAPASYPVQVAPVRMVHAQPNVTPYGYATAAPIYVPVQQGFVNAPQVHYHTVPVVTYGQLMPHPASRVRWRTVVAPAYGAYMAQPQYGGGWYGMPVMMYR